MRRAIVVRLADTRPIGRSIAVGRYFVSLHDIIL